MSLAGARLCNYMLNKKQIIDVKKNINQLILKEGEKLPIVFNALSDMGRFRIFRLLMAHYGICVTDIANILGISVPAASQQLRVLEMTGIVRKERVGQTILYGIRDEDPIIKSLLKIFPTNISPTKISDLKTGGQLNREKALPV